MFTKKKTNHYNRSSDPYESQVTYKTTSKRYQTLKQPFGAEEVYIQKK